MTITAKSADGVLHNFPDGTADSVIDGVMEDYAKQQAMAGQPQTVNEDEKGDPGGGISPLTYASDMANQFVKGAAEGIPALATGPVELGMFAGKKLAEEKLRYIDKMPEDQIQAALAATQQDQDSGAMSAFLKLPETVGKATGIGPAETVPGQYAKTAGEFLPNAINGGEGIGAKALAVLVPSVASETAGQLTKGTPVEPYARLSAALIGGGLAMPSKASAENAVLDNAGATTKELQAAKDTQYKLAENVGQTQIPVQDYASLVRTMNRNAPTGGAFAASTDAQIAKSTGALDTMTQVLKDTVAGDRPPPTFNDLEKMRQTLNDIAQNSLNAKGQISSDGRLAKQLIGQIDNFTENSGYPEARQAFAKLRRTQDLDYALKVADQSEDPARTLQTEFKKIARSQVSQARFSPAEMTLINQVANGTFKGNVPTLLSKLGLGADYIAGQAGKAITGGLGGEAAGMIASNLTRQGMRAVGKSRDAAAAEQAAVRARNLVSLGPRNRLSELMDQAGTRAQLGQRMNALTAFGSSNDSSSYAPPPGAIYRNALGEWFGKGPNNALVQLSP